LKVHDGWPCMCDATVSYALLTRGPLPLWPVWEDYLQHCPHGSYTVVVHSQNVSTSWLPAQALRIPASSTAIGDLRFSWRMVGAMLSTVQQAQGTRAPNGCVPRWIHFASESCAPVRPCARVHASLAADTGVSRMELRRVPHQVPAGYGVPNPKASQWMTLWLPHASALAADPRVLRSAQAATVGARRRHHVAQRDAPRCHRRAALARRIRRTRLPDATQRAHLRPLAGAGRAPPLATPARLPHACRRRRRVRRSAHRGLLLRAQVRAGAGRLCGAARVLAPRIATRTRLAGRRNAADRQTGRFECRRESPT